MFGTTSRVLRDLQQQINEVRRDAQQLRAPIGSDFLMEIPVVDEEGRPVPDPKYLGAPGLQAKKAMDVRSVVRFLCRERGVELRYVERRGRLELVEVHEE